MADDDGSRRPSQPSTPVNPAGVGSSASNRGSPAMVSPSILREILESGNQGLIDDAFEQWNAADMGRLLDTLPSSPPIRSSPAGVGSAAPNRSSPSPAVPRTPSGVAAGAGGGDGGGGSSSGWGPWSKDGASSRNFPSKWACVSLLTPRTPKP